MASWHKIIIPESDDAQKEIISALLMFNGADSVVDQDTFLEVYLNSDNLEAIESFINESEAINSNDITIEKVKSQNWNAVWESSFNPIDVGQVHVRAIFHPKTDKTEIVIQPKMAFGTGHHETTFMMIEKMSSMNFKGKSVLDYGCGTGILAVYARMKEAQTIDAIDIQLEAIENTLEHFELNNQRVDNLNVSVGDLDIIESTTYDVILANINRHVLLANANNLFNKLNNDGTLLVSGILKSDRELLLSTYEASDFTLKYENQKGEWCLFEFQVKH